MINLPEEAIPARRENPDHLTPVGCGHSSHFLTHLIINVNDLGGGDAGYLSGSHGLTLSAQRTISGLQLEVRDRKTPRFLVL